MRRLISATLLLLFTQVSAASEWQSLEPLAVAPDEGQVGVRVSHILVDPSASARVLVATYLGDVYRTEDGGDHWVLSEVGEIVTGLCCASDSVTTYYAVLKAGGLFRSTDGGDSWVTVEVSAGTGFARALAVAPSDPGRIYVGRTVEVVTSRDGGATWAEPDAASTMTPVVQAIAVDPVHADTLFISGGSVVYRSLDGGQVWETTLNTSGVLINSLRMGAAGTGEVFALSEDGIHRSDDLGVTWEKLSLERTVYDLVVDPENRWTMFAATGSGVWASSDGGDTWKAVGLQGARVWSLTMQDRTLYAGGNLRVYTREFAVRKRTDFDGDGVVRFADFLMFIRFYGTTEESGRWQPVYDLDADGDVDYEDYLVLAGEF